MTQVGTEAKSHSELDVSIFAFFGIFSFLNSLVYAKTIQNVTVMSRRYINYLNRLYMIMIENWRNNLLRGSWLHPFRFYRFLHECFKAKNAKNVLYFRYWGQTLAFVTPTDLFLEFGKVDCSKESRNSERKSWNWWR